MTVDQHVAGLFSRAGIAPAGGQLEAACAHMRIATDEVLEVSAARWANETEGGEVLAVLLRESIVLVGTQRQGFFKAPKHVVVAHQFGDFQYIAENDDLAGASVMFLAYDIERAFLLSWDRNVRERERMFRATFAAHRGDYSPWGLQLDPANYVADFDRFHAELRAEGPDEAGGMWKWVQERYGDFDITNALGFAADWRSCELDDAAGRSPSRRVRRISGPSPWDAPPAWPLLVRLGEQLHDAGSMDPPFDEPTFMTDEPLSPGDAGPARLLALMHLAAFARSVGHPRANEWIAAARAGLGDVPPTVFSGALRVLWADIGDLPEVE